LGDSEEVTPSSLQHTEIDVSIDNVESVPSPNELLLPSSRQRLLPRVPNFTLIEMGHGLANSILSLARVDGFEFFWCMEKGHLGL